MGLPHATKSRWLGMVEPSPRAELSHLDRCKGDKVSLLTGRLCPARALGHCATAPDQRLAMSALPPKATELRTSWHVSKVPEPDFADMFNLGQRADVCWLACLVQACHLQSAIQRHLTQFQVSRLCRIGMRSQPARGQLRLNPDGGAYPFRVQPTDAPAFARLIPSVRMRCSRVV